MKLPILCDEATDSGTDDRLCKQLRERCPEIRGSYLWGSEFWNGGYYAETTSAVLEEVGERYIEYGKTGDRMSDLTPDRSGSGKSPSNVVWETRSLRAESWVERSHWSNAVDGEIVSIRVGTRKLRASDSIRTGPCLTAGQIANY